MRLRSSLACLKHHPVLQGAAARRNPVPKSPPGRGVVGPSMMLTDERNSARRRSRLYKAAPHSAWRLRMTKPSGQPMGDFPCCPPRGLARQKRFSQDDQHPIPEARWRDAFTAIVEQRGDLDISSAMAARFQRLAEGDAVPAARRGTSGGTASASPAERAAAYSRSTGQQGARKVRQNCEMRYRIRLALTTDLVDQTANCKGVSPLRRRGPGRCGGG